MGEVKKKAKSGQIYFECESWKEEASIITKPFLGLFKSKTGVPILPPSENLILFF